MDEPTDRDEALVAQELEAFKRIKKAPRFKPGVGWWIGCAALGVWSAPSVWEELSPHFIPYGALRLALLVLGVVCCAQAAAENVEKRVEARLDALIELLEEDGWLRERVTAAVKKKIEGRI